MLDTIHRGIQRCLADARERVAYHIDQDCIRMGVTLSEEKRQARVERHPNVKAWQKVAESSRLLHSRLQLWAGSLRRPTSGSLEEAVCAVSEMEGTSQRPETVGNARRGHYHQLMALIARQTPTTQEPAKVREFLASGILPYQLQPWSVYQQRPEKPEGSLVDALTTEERGQIELPQDGLRLFETTWRHFCAQYKPDASSYGLALLMVSKLAAWQALLPGATDVWEPVRRLMEIIADQGMLRASHLNQVMWASLRYDPSLLEAQSGERTEDWSSVGWPSSDAYRQIYEEMRGNAVRAEMDALQHSQNKETIARNAPCIPPLDNALLGKVRTMPTDVLPTHLTYELLIRALTWRGDLRGAVVILDEMMQSQADSTKRLLSLRRGEQLSDPTSSPNFQPTLATFDAFFRGFCKHGVPSTLLDFDHSSPQKGQWVQTHTNEEANGWTIEALEGLLEGLLDLDAMSCRRAELGYPSAIEKEPEHSDHSSMLSSKLALRSPSLDIDKTSGLQSEDPSLTETWQSIASLQSPEQTRIESCHGPTRQQRFNILTALRRTSTDDPEWVIAQWQRVEDKFGPSGEGLDVCDEAGELINEEGWKGWKTDARLERVLLFLEKKRLDKLPDMQTQRGEQEEDYYDDEHDDEHDEGRESSSSTWSAP